MITDQLIEVIFSVSRRMHSVSANNPATHLSVLQLQALIFLKKHQNAQMSEVAGHFHIELPSATSLINKLVIMRLVLRKTDQKDRRLVRLALTEKGEMVLQEGMEERRKKISNLLSFLTENDKNELLRIMKKIAAKIKKHEK